MKRSHDMSNEKKIDVFERLIGLIDRLVEHYRENSLSSQVFSFQSIMLIWESILHFSLYQNSIKRMLFFFSWSIIVFCCNHLQGVHL